MFHWWHSFESPSMVDPQWNIWYWGSKWNLHTVCWKAVGCELGTTSVYFGITYVCFIPSRLPVFAVEPQNLHQYFFLFLSKVSFELHIQNLQKISCWFKIWTNIDEVLNVFHLRFSLVASLKVSRELLMQTCWWPLSDHWSVQPTSLHLSGFVFYGCLESLTELSALWVPYCFVRSSIKFQGHTGCKIDDLNPIWVRLLGRSQLSNPSDLPCFMGSATVLVYFPRSSM